MFLVLTLLFSWKKKSQTNVCFKNTTPYLCIRNLYNKEDEKRQVYSRSSWKLEILHQPVILLPTTRPVMQVFHKLFLPVMHLWDYLKRAQVTKDRTKECMQHLTSTGTLSTPSLAFGSLTHLKKAKGCSKEWNEGVNENCFSGATYRGPRQTGSRDITLLVEM